MKFCPSPVLQDNNTIVKEYGTKRTEEKLYNHVDLVALLDIVNLEAGQTVAGGRGYYLINEGVLLNQVTSCSTWSRKGCATGVGNKSGW